MRSIPKVLSSIVTLCILVTAGFASAAGQGQWVASWASAQQDKSQTITLENVTLRQIVHISLGGTQVRIHFSNLYGVQPLSIGSAHVSLRGGDLNPQAGTDRVLKFNGFETLQIPSGQEATSDAINLAIPNSSDLMISVYLPVKTVLETVHVDSRQTNYISQPGHFLAESFQPARVITFWAFLSEVDVLTTQVGAIVAFGDSITDGVAVTMDSNLRWPNQLANRILAGTGTKMAVVDMGIGYNRVLQDQPDAGEPSVSALRRFPHDVLAMSGATEVIFIEGINDIGLSPETAVLSSKDLIAGYRSLIQMAHTAKLRIIGGTLTPFGGCGYYSPAKEKVRQEVNQWIRTGGGFDAIVDFDQAIRDPASPEKMSAAFDSGDHLHPSDAGYTAMANAISLLSLEVSSGH